MMRVVRERSGDWAVWDDATNQPVADGLTEDEARTMTGELREPPPAPMGDTARLYADRPSRRLTKASR